MSLANPTSTLSFGEGSGDLPWLKCPNCGHDCMHHERVEVFDCLEDSPGVHAVMDGTGVKVDIDMSGNPSARRDGMLVHFSCEGCSCLPVLVISQHKGNTEIGWRLPHPFAPKDSA